MTQTPVVARMSEGFREPPVVGNREEGQGGKHQSSTEVGGGAAIVVETIALLEGPGRSPVESPEDARIKQVVPAAPTGPPVSYQPMGPPVVYTATGGAQNSQVARMSQQSMCAGVPPTGMVPQWGTAVVDPGVVTGVMAAEETNPWSAAKRVEAPMSSPQTPVKESTYPTVSQDRIDRADARGKEKYEELKIVETTNDGILSTGQDRDPTRWRKLVCHAGGETCYGTGPRSRRRPQGLSVKWGVLSNRLAGAEEYRAVFSCGAISRCSTPRTTFARSTSSGNSTLP